MADRVYPSAKPAAAVNGAGTGNGGSNTGFPPNKAQLYNATRPVYRPQRPPKRGRSCCCSCCLFITVIIILIIVLAAVASAVLWVIYRPQRPNFSVSSLQVSEFNLTSSSSAQLKSKFNFTLIALNPNKKVTFSYDPVSVSLFADGVDIGDGSFPGFVHGTRNTTTLRTVISKSGQSMDSTDVSALRSDLKNRNDLPVKIQLDTKVKVKVGGFKTKKVPIRVTCNGIKLALPSGKKPTISSSSNVKCKVDLRIKIWKWTV